MQEIGHNHKKDCIRASGGEPSDPSVGSKAQYKGDCRIHGLQDPSVYVVFWAPKGMVLVPTGRLRLYGCSSRPQPYIGLLS